MGRHVASELIALVLLGSILTFAVVAILIWLEASSTTVTDREEAEQEARQFGGREGPSDPD